MSEQEGVIRVNISVPWTLKQDMEEVPEPTNWSAVACDAFRSHLLGLQARREAKTMEEVIARMRAADELERNQRYQQGREAGDRWAKRSARPRELRALKKWLDFSQEPLVDRMAAMADEEGIDRHLYKVVDRSWDDSPRAFWECVLGQDGDEQIADQHFACGFVEGALAIWAQVEGRLSGPAALPGPTPQPVPGTPRKATEKVVVKVRKLNPDGSPGTQRGRYTILKGPNERGSRWLREHFPVREVRTPNTGEGDGYVVEVVGATLEDMGLQPGWTPG